MITKDQFLSPQMDKATSILAKSLNRDQLNFTKHAKPIANKMVGGASSIGHSQIGLYDNNNNARDSS